MEEAISLGLAALNNARRSLPSLLMVAGELDAELTRQWGDEVAVESFREAVRSL
jgi:hypothetical protein